MGKLYCAYLNFVDKLHDLPPLIFRLLLAYGFYGPALNKIQHFNNVVEWFGRIGIPAPLINASMAVATETLGVILMTLGLGVRIIAVPMMFVMCVAIYTVHLKNGFSCGKNGFEIPFYYLLILFSLIVSGAGKFSLDAIIQSRCSRKD